MIKFFFISATDISENADKDRNQKSIRVVRAIRGDSWPLIF